MSRVELADWWRVGRGDGQGPRRFAKGDAPASPPAHVGLWLDRMLSQPYARRDQEWTARHQLYDVARKALAPGRTPISDPPAVAGYRPFLAAWRAAVEKPPTGLVRRTLTLEAGSRILLHPATGSTVTEGTILLHHTYGVPYLPGSALKGAVRSRLEHLAAGGSPEAARFAELAGEILGRLRPPGTRGGEEAPAVTGTEEEAREDQGLASLVDFWDALWLPRRPTVAGRDWSPLALDIVNPHHPGYYTEHEGARQLPTEADEPIPVHRLTLAPGCRFLVVMEAPDAPQLAPWLDWLLDRVLLPALAEDGLGAWTTAGYGRLRRVDDDAAGSEVSYEAQPTAKSWQAAQVFYHAGKGELSAQLADGERASALKSETERLLAGLPEAPRATLTKKGKRQATLEVRLERQGTEWRIAAMRLPEDSQ